MTVESFTFMPPMPGSDPAAPAPITPPAPAPAPAQNNGAPAPQFPQIAPAPAPTDDGIPVKFRNADGSVNVAALAKSYKELEMQRTVQQRPAVTLPSALAPQPAPGQPPPAQQPLPMEALGREFMANDGNFLPETISALAARGYNAEMVLGHFAGQRALAEQRAVKGYEAAGGKEAFETMKQWAGANWTPEEKSAFTQMVSMGPAAMQTAVRDLKARYEAANGTQQGQLTQGTPQGGVAGFASQYEQNAAINDPRYRQDAAYRATVERRVLMSNF